MLRVVHFDICVDDPERAKRFYSDVFGWKIQKWEGPMDYWLVDTGSPGEYGVNGGLMMREDPSTTTINSIEVPSVEDFTAKITASGGKIVKPRMAVPDIGYFALCRDTEGNLFGIIEPDKSAK
jgi:predicted enzyme related to lactoylglutathione lyase